MWNLVGKARQAVKGYIRDQKPRTAPKPLIGAQPAYLKNVPHRKPTRAVRPDLDRGAIPVRSYSNPQNGQGVGAAPVASALPAGVSIGRATQVEGRTWKTYSIDLSVARVDQLIWQPGDLVWMFSSTNATDQLSVRFVDYPGDQRSDPIPFHEGNAIGGDPFKGIALTNAATPGATAVLLVTQSPAFIDGGDN